MGFVKKGTRVLREEGVLALILKFYTNYLRPRLPEKGGRGKQRLNGVTVESRDAKVFDSLIGLPYWESDQLRLLERYASRGDTVLDIGAGIGVSTVHAAQVAGENGRVLAYEPSGRSIQNLSDTIEQNRTPAEVELHHAVVGEVVDQEEPLTNGNDEPDVIDPGNLPKCDVLMLDCEGAELNIFRNMVIGPQVIIVETHGKAGSPASEVIDTLQERGYEVTARLGSHKDVSNIAFHRDRSN